MLWRIFAVFFQTMNFSDVTQLPTILQSVVIYQNLSIGQTLFHRHAAAMKIYMVQSGVIQLLHYTQGGHIINHYQVKAGEICVESSLFSETYPCEAIADAPTQILVFPKVAFLAALEADFNFATAFMQQISHRLHLTQMMLESRSIRSARERVLHRLHSLALKQNTIVLNYPLKNLADDLGLSPEVLSRTLTQLKKEGKITREKRKIMLLE